jgi:POT family proton-dependent oligopeptide transporter
MAYSEKVRLPTLSLPHNANAQQYVGFWLAYTLPTVVFLFCPIVLIAGRNRYIRSPPTGSILALFLHALGFAARGKWTLNPVRLYKNFTADEFWDAAKPSNVPVEAQPKWMVYDDQWVAEVKRGIAACWVFLFFPIYCVYPILSSRAGERLIESGG